LYHFHLQKTANIFIQILNAIEYAHEQGVIHRDIKLENILMDSSGKVFVLDFGLCDLVESSISLSSKFCGSIDYVAPEVISTKHYSGFKADMFSLGVVLYTLLFAEFPFVARNRIEAIKKKLEQPPIAFTDAKNEEIWSWKRCKRTYYKNASI